MAKDPGSSLLTIRSDSKDESHRNSCLRNTGELPVSSGRLVLWEILFDKPSPPSMVLSSIVPGRIRNMNKRCHPTKCSS